MSDNGDVKKDVNPEERKSIKMTVELHPTEGLKVEGPGNGQVFDEPMCFYLARKACQFVERHNAKFHESKIIKANQPGGIMNFARSRLRR